jgi:hypothetical protein
MRTLFPFLLALSLSASAGPLPASEPGEPAQSPVKVVFTGPIAVPVHVDELYTGSLPIMVFLVPGTHVVKAELSPNRFCTQTIEVEGVEGARDPYDDEGPDPFGVPQVRPQLFKIDC